MGEQEAVGRDLGAAGPVVLRNGKDQLSALEQHTTLTILSLPQSLVNSPAVVGHNTSYPRSHEYQWH